MTPRRELVALVKIYALCAGTGYGAAWRELARRYHARYGAHLFAVASSYREDSGIRAVTLPAFLEQTHRLAEAVDIAREMVVWGTGG